MADEKRQHDQFGKNADATSGGGASADRTGRDAGMPGPAPGSATDEGTPRGDSNQCDRARAGADDSGPPAAAR